MKLDNNIVPTEPIPVTTPLSPSSKGPSFVKELRQYDSLVGFWNQWYSQYYFEDSFPRLMIRFEDLLFHTEIIVTQVCQCAGGQLKEETVRLPADSSKSGKSAHNRVHKANGLVGAMLQYGKMHNINGSRSTMTTDDVSYAKEMLSEDIMEAFCYKF